MTPAPAGTPAATPELPPVTTTPSAATTPNLLELWKQILGSLELPSTRMLLSQQGQLVQLDAHRAVVQVSSNWMGMVQSRAALLEQAIAKALGGNRQLVLEASNTVIPGQMAPSPPPQAQTPPAAVAPPAPTPPPAAPVVEPTLPRPTSPAKGAEETTTTKDQAPKQTKPVEFSGVDRQAKNLADFFNGQVLDVDLKS